MDSQQSRVDSQCKVASECLRAQRDAIIGRWEARVRQDVPAAQAQSTPALRDHLPDFLENLAYLLSRGERLKLVRESADLGKKHGGQRADLQTYSLDQILTEYRHLRQAIFEVLSERTQLNTDVAQVIHDAIDRAIANASTEFIRHTTERDRASQLERERLLRQLSIQFTVARILAEQDNVSTAMEKILETICTRKKWDLGIVWYTDRTLQVLRTIQIWNRPDGIPAEFIEATRKTAFTRGHGIPGKAWETGNFVSVGADQEMRRLPRGDIALKEGLHGAIAFPMRVGDETHGVIEFYSREAKEPDQPMLDLLNALGSQIAQYIERRQSENVVRAVIEVALDAIIGMDHHGKVTEFNPAAERIFGYRRSEAMGKDLADLIIPPFLREKHRQGIVRYVTTGVTQYMGRRLEFPAIRKDGSEVLVELAVTDIPDSQPRAFTGFIREITERKQAEAKLANERSKLAAIFQQSPAAMALWRGPDLVFEMVNPQYQAIFEKRSLLGKPFLEALPEFRSQPFADLIRKVLETGEPFTGHELLARLRRTPDGPLEDHYYDFTYVRLDDPDGKAYGVYDHAIDVTDRVMGRRELKIKQDQLEATVRELELERDLRDQFVSALTHDLRTPLTAAKMSAQIIQRNPDQAEKVQSFAARINLSIERADHMIRDLLDVSLIRAGHPLALRPESCDLTAVVSTTLDELATVHGNRFVLRSDDSVKGSWDCSAIKRLVENLCNNAVKYGDPHQPITVTIQTGRDTVTLAVHNEGNPIPQEVRKVLFQYLRRTPQAETSGKRGWGIGLTLVRGVAEAHGGTVSVSSSAEKGTEFRVTLPRTARS